MTTLAKAISLLTRRVSDLEERLERYESRLTVLESYYEPEDNPAAYYDEHIDPPDYSRYD